MTNRLPEGKVPWDLVGELVGGTLPSEVVLGPACGEDAALIRIGNEVWAVATDPISFTAADAGRLSVLVNANDVAVRGAEPRFFLAVVLIAPEEASPERVRDLLGQVRDTCAELGIALVGGHTEVTPGLAHSMVVGTMLGPVLVRPLTTGGLRPGDRIGMTGAAGLEGTAILLGELGPRLSALHPEEDLRSPVELLPPGGLSVVTEALACARTDGVSALHDVTEGGVGEALHEMSTASGLPLDVERERIPVLPETARLCDDLGLDPLGLIGSGSLLVGCAPEHTSGVERALSTVGVPFRWIARALEAGEIARTALPRFPQDELLKANLAAGVEAVVFDLDGTLVDSEYDWRAIRSHLGVTGPSIIDELNGLDEPQRSARWAEMRRFEAEATDGAVLHKGVRELLSVLGAAGLKTALVTNNDDTNAHRLLDRFDLRFDEVLTRSCGLWKPSGAPIAEAMRRLGVAPEHTLAVGDSRYDLQSAREAGCARVVLVYRGAELHGELADHAFRDIRSLLNHLRLVLPGQ